MSFCVNIFSLWKDIYANLNVRGWIISYMNASFSCIKCESPLRWIFFTFNCISTRLYVCTIRSSYFANIVAIFLQSSSRFLSPRESSLWLPRVPVVSVNWPVSLSYHFYLTLFFDQNIHIIFLQFCSQNTESINKNL